ncbi:hypothetical protein UCRPC4_g05751 [Phaeomoniella chlamydospora]|uniref:Uncharacterized protein n=1 Tax=Phaeomoniella chlamydospora TaxID=158046 RepID=A0A0G2GJB0_PHACM|nr:hypothetical protein UCRPC4_g05751 [Phaeomoniella chlamydospora]
MFETIDPMTMLEIQILILDNAISNWRPYLLDLQAESDLHVAAILGATPDDSGPIRMSNAGERQSLMVLDGKVLNSLAAVKHTKEVVSALSAAYNSASEGSTSSNNINIALSEKLSDLDILSLKLQTMRTTIQGISNLVSNFLDLNSGYALQELARESRRENEEMRKLSERMHRLAEKSTQDAASVKVLTILTLIYLPATVVSNFFSTSFVGTGSNEHIFVTPDWWIFLVAAVALTAFTLYVWWVWMNIQVHRKYPWWWARKLDGELG